jgi:hypothetical protein
VEVARRPQQVLGLPVLAIVAVVVLLGWPRSTCGCDSLL